MRPQQRVLLWCIVCVTGVIAGAALLGQAADAPPEPLLPPPEALPAPPGNATAGPLAEPSEAAPPDEAARPLRDPTQPGPELREILVPPQAVAQGTVAGPPPMPQVALKGRVILRQRPGTALLEVDGTLISVRDGADATVAASRAGLLTLHVLEISASAVRVEVLPQKQEIVLR